MVCEHLTFALNFVALDKADLDCHCEDGGF